MSLITATKLLGNEHISQEHARKLHEFLKEKGCPPSQNGDSRGTYYPEAKASMLMAEFKELVRAGAKRKGAVGKAPSRAKKQEEGGMLLVFPIGKNESITLDMARAEGLWKQLNRIFGSN